jgi:hypothetical protein
MMKDKVTTPSASATKPKSNRKILLSGIVVGILIGLTIGIARESVILGIIVGACITLLWNAGAKEKGNTSTS